MSTTDAILQLRGITRDFKLGSQTVHVLKGIDLDIGKNEYVALMGPPGSGKSTLMNLLGCLDTPTSGNYELNGTDVSSLNDNALAEIRNSEIGFVFQTFNLLPRSTALENVALPQIIGGKKPKEAKEKAADLLEGLGLGKRLEHRPATLSGGEQQRVAIARALVNDPKLLLADEPTGNLDPGSSAEVFAMLLEQARVRKIGALVATHNLELADQMDRGVEMKNGRLVPFD